MTELSRRVILGAAPGLVLCGGAALADRPSEALTALAADLDREAGGLAHDPQGALGRVQARLQAAARMGAFDAWRGRPVAETHKIAVLGGGGLVRSWKVQLFFIPDGHSHPPHCHENLASCMVVADGRIRLREFERLRDRETPDAARLRRVFEGELARGDGMVTAEDYRNAHWFGAVGGSALAVNFKASGHARRELLRLTNRRYLDASAGGEGEFQAPFISRAEAHARFAARPL